MRAVFLLVIVVGLTIFALQNVEPALSLVFLGIRSPAVPLSIWILLSMAAGAVTSLLISGMLSFSNYLSQPRDRSGRDSRSRSDSFPTDRRTPNSPPPPPRKQEIDPDLNRENSQAQSASYRTQYGTPAGYGARTFQQETPNPVGAKDYAAAGSSIADDEDDWVSDGSKSANGASDDDWGDGDLAADSQLNDLGQGANPRDYETKQEPKSKSWAGSVYSYGYRDPNQSGVGQTESVYDAEYRVVVPPQESILNSNSAGVSPNPSAEAEEDWGLDEDDVFDEDDRPSGSINLKK